MGGGLLREYTGGSEQGVPPLGIRVESGERPQQVLATELGMGLGD